MSDYQDTVNWAAVKAAGVTGAFTKATEGVGWVAQTFPTNWRALGALGLGRGCYDLTRPDLNDPTSEAQFFISTVNAVDPIGPEDKVAGDFEKGSGDLSGWALTWLQLVEASIGRPPYFYSGEWFMGPCNLYVPALARYPLWLGAAYDQPEPPAPAPWDKISIWQSTASGHVSGIAGVVDLDVAEVA